MTDQKPLPRGFGEGEGSANRSAIWVPILVSAVVAAMVSAVVAFGMGRAWPEPTSPNPPGVDPSRLTVLEEQQAKFDERLTAAEFKAPAPASPEMGPEQKARAMLEARVAEGNASPEELKMLRAI
ncbi:MAG: hypothetical protein U1E22_01775, partial [Coriobacteriia bacterium]|nr:hypothetical protein [Coriobacteriia bacterium]